MSFQPGFAAVAALVADPAREAMLVALADGRALPAGELASIAGISAQSASRHLRRMVDGGVLNVWSQGRFRYYRIADPQVMSALESLSVLAQSPDAKSRRKSVQRTPSRELKFARRCYDHLAGELGTQLLAVMHRSGFVSINLDEGCVDLTPAGTDWLSSQGIQISEPKNNRPPLRLCLDWTERHHHLAGPQASAILRYLIDHRHLLASPGGGRALQMTPKGRAWFARNGVVTLDSEDRVGELRA